MTRKELSRALAVNAITKPVNVVAPAGVLVAGLLLGVVWLVPVAIVCWLALVAVTFFDEREARAAGDGHGRAGARLHHGRRRCARGASPPRSRGACGGRRRPRVDPAAVGASTGRWMTWRARSTRSCSRSRPRGARAAHPRLPRRGVTATPARADRARAVGRGQAPRWSPSSGARTRLQRRLTRLFEEMDHVVATLQTVHAEILAPTAWPGHARRAGERAARERPGRSRRASRTRSRETRAG